MHGSFVRTIGIARAKASFALTCLVYNIMRRSLQHRFSHFILATCSPSACSRLPASCPLFFLDAARCACKKTTTNLPGQPTTISPGSNDRFGFNPKYYLSFSRVWRFSGKPNGYDLSTMKTKQVPLQHNSHIKVPKKVRTVIKMAIKGYKWQ